MKPFAIAAFAGGAIVLTLLIAHFGGESVLDALTRLGLLRFLAVVVFHGVLIVVMGAAWWVLGSHRRDAAIGRYVWGRLIRDSASEVLPLSQIGGFVLGARALSTAGVAGGFAAASTVVDLTMELMAQLAYTLLGLALLALLDPGNPLVKQVLAAVAGMFVLALVFQFVQARGAALIERISLKLTRQWLGEAEARSSTVQADIVDLHRRRGRLALAAALHLGTWIGSGVECWLTLRFMGVGLDLWAALVIDSLLYGIRSFAFMIPNALGVQEAAYVLLGGLFGVVPATALALSLVRRGRDLLIGIPALLLWQGQEGWRAWRTR